MALTSRFNPSSDPRGAPRIPIGRDGTIRDAANQPVEIVVQDVSANGCLLHSPLALPENQVLGIGLPGLGRREGRIVWRDGERHGIEFLWPLSATELADVQSTDNLTIGIFPQRLETMLAPEEAEPPSRLTIPSIALMVVASAAIWAGIAYGTAALVG